MLGFTKLASFGAPSALLMLGRFWKELLIIVLMIVIGYQNLSDSRWVLWADTIPYLKAELATKKYEVDIIMQANQQLQTAIEERNFEIEQWGKVTNQLQQNKTILEKELANEQKITKERVKIVERQIIPKECSGAMDFLYESGNELRFNERN